MTALTELNLKHTNITDAGLRHLRDLTNLQALRFVGTQVTDEGISELQQALPGCEIRR